MNLKEFKAGDFKNPENLVTTINIFKKIQKYLKDDSKILELSETRTYINSPTNLNVTVHKLNEKIKLPYKRNAFDISISAEVPSSFDSSQVSELIFEIVRVTKTAAIIVTEEQNEKVTREEILVTVDKVLRKLDKKARTTTHGIFNRKVRSVLHRASKTKAKKIVNKLSLKLITLLSKMNIEKTHKRMFVIEFLV